MVFNVTNSGSGAYIIDGASNPALTVVRGRTYTFNINAAGHPFWLQTGAGAYNSSNTYSTGVTNGGTQSGTITWEVSLLAPNTLYYVCQNHSSMNGQINVVDEGLATEVSVSTINLRLVARAPSIPTTGYGDPGGVTVFNVGSTGTDNYVINNEVNPALTVIRGRTYTFEVSTPGIPFWLQTTAGAYDASKTYSTGVTNGGNSAGTITWQVSLSAPSSLYYITEFYPAMSGQIFLIDEVPRTEVAVPAINFQITRKAPSIITGAGVVAPRVNLRLTGLVPYILRVCVLIPPVPEPEPEPEKVISTPTPPGVTYADLPVIDTVTQIIDTSPDEIIGCANVLITGNEQTILDALFPAASNKDGVVNRANNDIWTYNGSIWTNVGPTPGRQLTITKVLPAYNEIQVITGLTRVTSSVEAINYSLIPVTVEPTTVVKVRPGIVAGFITVTVEVPSFALTLRSFPPYFTSLIGLVGGPVYGRSAYMIPYTGKGAGRSVVIPIPYPASMVFFFQLDTEANKLYDKPWFDATKGGNRYWSPDTQQESSRPGMIQFNSNNITIAGTNAFADYTLNNALGVNYKAYIFTGSTTGVVNNDGAIASTVYTGSAFNIISYTGTGSDTTVGHGLGAEPAALFFRRASTLTGSTYSSEFFSMVGRDIGLYYYVQPTFSANGKSFSDGVPSGYNNSTFSLSGSGYNDLGRQHICYAFKEVEGVCKIGKFYGNELPTGKFVNCGFAVNLVMIKAVVEGARDISFGPFCILDSSAAASAPIHTLDGSDIASTTPGYEFTEEGFRVYAVPEIGSTEYSQTLNKRGVEYIFIAFAKYDFVKVECPSAGFTVQKWPPQVVTGGVITVPAFVAYNLAGIKPSYIGTSLYAILPPTVGITFQPLPPVLATGVKIALNVIDLAFKKTEVRYVGEATKDAQEYIAVVGDRDGSPLERPLKACVYNLFNDLKEKSLLDKFITIVPLCLAKTIIGATTPLIGRYPAIAERIAYGNYSSASTWLNYKRRTGARPYRYDAKSWSETSVDMVEAPATNNHMAAYITEQNTAGPTGETYQFGGNTYSYMFAGELMGAGTDLYPNQFAMFRTNPDSSVFSGAGPSFTFANKTNQNNHVTAAPHWSEPSLVGMTRNNANNYTVRVAKTNRAANIPIVAQTDNNAYAAEMRVFRTDSDDTGTMGDFRIPFYSIGYALDLAELETIIETFLARVAAALPDVMIAAPVTTFEIASPAPDITTIIKVFASTIRLTLEALDPVYAGIPKTVIRCPRSRITLMVFPPSIDAARYLAPAANLGVDLLLNSGVASALEGGRLVDIVQVGTAAPLLGAAATTAYDGWTRIWNQYSDDNFVETSTWPFTFTIGSTGYTSAFVAANTYITFGGGSTSYSGLSASNPSLRKIHFGAADNAMQKVYTQAGIVQGRLVQRIRYEGSSSRSSTAVSSIIAEFTFFEQFTDGQQLIELRFGNHDKLTSPFMIATTGTAYATATVVANTSWVFIGNSTGTAWTMTSGRYAA